MPGGICVVELRGALTPSAIQTFKADVLAAIEQEDVRAFVADYRRCVVALSGADLDRVLLDDGPPSAATLPAAMIVPLDLVPLFRGHAIRMAAHGHFRRVFAEFAPALVWAQEMAAGR